MGRSTGDGQQEKSQKHGCTASKFRNRGRLAWRLHAVVEFRVDFLIIVFIIEFTATRQPCHEVTL